MKKTLACLLVLGLLSGVTMLGCGQKKAASSGEAITASEAMQTVKAKVDYLVGQAKAFYNSKEYQKAVDVAQYVLAKLDSNSQEAKSLLEKAKAALTQAAQNAMSGAKQKLGF